MSWVAGSQISIHRSALSNQEEHSNPSLGVQRNNEVTGEEIQSANEYMLHTCSTVHTHTSNKMLLLGSTWVRTWGRRWGLRVLFQIDHVQLTEL